MSSHGEGQAIMRNPPGGNTVTAGAGCVDTRYRAQSLALAAATSSAATKILTAADACAGGCFVTFKNPGTTAITITFGDSGIGAAVAGDFPILPGEREEWWCVSETHFRALCSADATLNWYRSSN